MSIPSSGSPDHTAQIERVQLAVDFVERLNARYAAESLRWDLRGYRANPAKFAYDVLGSIYWHKQERSARAVATHRRVAVKSANGVGKTYLAADLALWFLCCYQPSIVLTTAPTWRQVRHVLWEEIRRRFVNAKQKMPGTLLATRIKVDEGWFAIGLATDRPDKFQGFHARNILIILDEASGIPDPIWDAAETIAVGQNNKILAIGNPLRTDGRFYRIFRDRSGWLKLTISALEHPNITGNGRQIPGAVTLPYLEDRLTDWCERLESFSSSSSSSCSAGTYDEGEGLSPPEHMDQPRAGPDSQHSGFSGSPPVREPGTINSQLDHTPDTFTFNGNCYRPNNLFRARVLGEFPDAGDESLISLRWIEAATEDNRTLPAEGIRRAAADIARFGDDSTVIGFRIGPVVKHFDVVHGSDTMEVAGKIKNLAYDLSPQAIAIDSIGIGAGVVDRLFEMGVEGVEAVNVSKPAFDVERFANRRAELYWGLRERFHTGDIVIPREEKLIEELASIKYLITSRGQIQIESKDKMKRRSASSPDRADMLALLFDGAADSLLSWNEHAAPAYVTPSPATLLREEMRNW